MENLIKSIEIDLAYIREDLRNLISNKVVVNKYKCILIPITKELIINDKVINKLEYTDYADIGLGTIVRLFYNNTYSFINLAEITNIQSLLKIANAIKDL